MADEKEGPGEGQNDAEQPKSKPTILLVIGLAVLVMLLTPVITIFAFKSMADTTAPADAPEKPPVEIILGRVQVNVKDTQGTRFAQVDPVLLVSDEAMKPLFEVQSDEQPKGKLRRLRSVAIYIISEKNLAELLSPGSKESLAAELKDAFNEVLEPYTEGVVTEVYFDGFLIQ